LGTGGVGFLLRRFVLPVLYFVFWIVLNGRVTVETVISGLVIAACVSLLNYCFVGIGFGTEKRIWRKAHIIVVFVLVMVVEVIKANLQIIRLVLAPKIKIKPQIVSRLYLTRVKLIDTISITNFVLVGFCMVGYFLAPKNAITK